MGNDGTTRRDMLKKAAVAGAVVWTVPTVTASPAFAAGSIGTNLCRTGVKPYTVTYQWAYKTNSFSVCENPGGLPTNQAVQSSGDMDSDWEYAIVTAQRDTGGQGGTQTVQVDGGPDKFISFGGTFILTGTLDPNTTVTLTRANADGTPYAPAEVNTTTYHFSCSQPLCDGDKHGPLEVVSYDVS